jgi:hypothetical protein
MEPQTTITDREQFRRAIQDAQLSGMPIDKAILTILTPTILNLFDQLEKVQARIAELESGGDPSV